jgi:hypothetical protein
MAALIENPRAPGAEPRRSRLQTRGFARNTSHLAEGCALAINARAGERAQSAQRITCSWRFPQPDRSAKGGASHSIVGLVSDFKTANTCERSSNVAPAFRRSARSTSSVTPSVRTSRCVARPRRPSKSCPPRRPLDDDALHAPIALGARAGHPATRCRSGGLSGAMLSRDSRISQK